MEKNKSSLESSRFASTYSRTMYNDLAYAPGACPELARLGELAHRGGRSRRSETYAATGSTGVTNIAFAGNNEDTSAALYDAQYREYGIQGRWPSPDPAGIAAANPENPQSWNRYAYVFNNPLLLIDPSGFGPKGCFAAGMQERGPLSYAAARQGGVPNDVDCGPDNGGYCDVDGALVPCGGGSSSGGGGGGVQTLCVGELNYQTCYVFNLGGGGPGGGDLCGGGDCFGGGGGPGSPGNPTPQSPTSPKSPDDVENCEIEAYTNADAAAADLYSLRNQFKNPLKAAVAGTVSGAVIGCVTTVEVGCVEAAVPGAVVGFLGGLLEGTAVQLYHNYVDTRQIINQLKSSLAACGGG
ncbi:MAG TPA: RHS repeat-associated core domain-containing protein [Candidatus Acidoferrales bacterium]|nr:RHS repeat-associated core domain-containing protein [Candidatus Acidoferrales bacterium]